MNTNAAITIYERKYPELSDEEVLAQMRRDSHEAFIELRGIKLDAVLKECWRRTIQRDRLSLASLEKARQMVDAVFDKFWDRRTAFEDVDEVDEILTALIRETYNEFFGPPQHVAGQTSHEARATG